MNKGIKDNLIEKGIFSELDIHFANLMQSLDDRNDQAVFLAAALVSNYKHKGHVCLDFRELKNTYLSKMEEHTGESFPENEEWIGILRKSPVVGKPGDFKPLILDFSSRLYLNRYYGYQDSIAQHIKHIAKRQVPIPDRILLEKGLDRLFPSSLKGGSIDLQRVAAIVSAHKQLCVISGGPGTGKTTTVTGIIALLLEQAGREGLNIILAAPTGKSAARLRESVKKAGEKIVAPDFVKDLIPEKAFTIHRMLGTTANAPFFKYNKNNRLDADVVIVDEASMIDIALMAKLLEALRDDAKLVLIGDRHQLASVEAGSVFADICGPFDTNKFSDKFSGKLKVILNGTTGRGVDLGENIDVPYGISDSVVQLEQSFRFKEGSGIEAVSKAVRRGDDLLSLSLINDVKYEDICLKGLPGVHELEAAISDTVIQGYEGFINAKNPMDAIDKFDEFRVLCVLREGPYGVAALNHAIESILERKGLVQTKDAWYPGRPVMMTVNDYNLGLFNGDTGIALTDPEDDLEDDQAGNGSVYVFFKDGDGLRKIHPHRLSGCETAYALTAHKSQGSEYDRILVVLPDRVLPILTRELIYTGITRAKSEVEILSDDNIFRQGVSGKIERASGLFDSLWDYSNTFNRSRLKEGT